MEIFSYGSFRSTGSLFLFFGLCFALVLTGCDSASSGMDDETDTNEEIDITGAWAMDFSPDSPPPDTFDQYIEFTESGESTVTVTGYFNEGDCWSMGTDPDWEQEGPNEYFVPEEDITVTVSRAGEGELLVESDSSDAFSLHDAADKTFEPVCGGG
jgi:hypothetical protein